MITFWRIVIAGTRNFFRNAWLSTAATAVMFVTLVLVLASFYVSQALNSTIKNIQNKIDVSVYLQDGLTQDQIADFQTALQHQDNVQSVNYVTKAQAADIFRQEHADNPKLLSAFNATDNPLPASFQIKVKDPKKLDSVAALVQQPKYQAMLDPSAPPSYSGKNKTTIDRIVKVSGFLKTAGLVASLVFAIISILIIFNTIRMAIYTRKSEIEIMKLVGATNWFIRGPFLFEASLYGIIAAVFATVVGYTLILLTGPSVANYLDIGQTVSLFRNFPLLVILGELFIGIAIGCLSSLLAMSRYLQL